MRRILRRAMRVLPVVFRIAFVLMVLLILNNLAHMCFSFCPCHFARLERSELIPVMIASLRCDLTKCPKMGDLVIGGGSRPVFVGARCPYCGWPAELGDWIDPLPEKAVDLRSLHGLSKWEAEEAVRYAREVTSLSQADSPDRVTCALVTPTDVWFGTMYHGAHRLDRETRKCTSYFRTGLGSPVKSMRLEGCRLIIYHDVLGGSGLFYEDYTADRGKTWIRL